MIKNILGAEFKYENDKMYRKLKTKWSCCNDVKSDKGYIKIDIDKKRYPLHRLIYKYHNEDWDITYSHNNQIDHININSLDNRIENLRVLTASQNNRNRNKFKNCSSIYKGVSWHKRDKKWFARINIDGKNKYLGQFDNEEEAHLAYEKEYEELMPV
tara:strand:+ start:62 stop:532 length:471 start_codon:yes stop_codon:yes gene_type:complete